MWCLNTGSLLDAFTLPIFGMHGKATCSSEQLENAKNIVAEKIKFFEERLADRTYLVGHSVTNADLCLMSVLFTLYQYFLDEKERHKYPHCLRFFNNLSAASYVKCFLGDHRRLCTKICPLVLPEGQEKKVVAAAPQKGKEEKKEAKKPQQPLVKKEDLPIKPQEPETTFDLFAFKNPFELRPFFFILLYEFRFAHPIVKIVFP
jgi:elongation factor 1-gamma